ncbi:zinc-ribbon domain-containing protein [Alkalihalobacillus sp. CinArs1]|uniref:zinc-ribbon domain-containing protein n=1 Tax=Alkalihalobacillus sp. CinArs1 TaxID=2995314 RepID=UPI0022DE0C10|nr:zinc ribbon domain-containing protein [Alkalihalobacillus sp. CinArs1]
MFCPNCGTKNTEHARFCIQCGHSYTNKQKKSKWLFTSMLIIVLLMSGGLIYHFVLNNTRTEEILGKEEIQSQTDVEANAPQSEEQTAAKKDTEKETTTVDKEEKNSTVQKAPQVKPSTQPTLML